MIKLFSSCTARHTGTPAFWRTRGDSIVTSWNSRSGWTLNCSGMYSRNTRSKSAVWDEGTPYHTLGSPKWL